MNLPALFDDLVRFETLLWNAVDARLRDETGLPLGSLDVMRIIGATPRCRVYDIAEGLAITVGGASQAVDRLEKRGHCARRPNPDDRRSSIVELTPEGQALLETASTVFERELADFFATPPLRREALDHLATTLATLRAAAQERSRR
ncbi:MULTISPECIES: MarR family winged helix-turn-helix transcriptional regulator [Amycolatopsis]|uniref:DNA-binding transcriptional regulator, MarR family n=2 Tax=Amycolatopsis TaxID=1813 RepID=A0A1I3Z137_9PSEU|nr:MarR family transcriptional regulator [Amycolatopsis sacchari]SFK37329.1 DNA-binding transcriptional regulator, MarR family [Amycolatopsis sacchari]